MIERNPASLATVADGSKVKYPFLLQESQKLLPARYNLGQRPRRKCRVFLQTINQIFTQEVGKSNLTRMERRQYLQQLNGCSDELGNNTKAVHQNKLFGFPLG